LIAKPPIRVRRLTRPGVFFLAAFPLVVIAYQGFPFPFVATPPIVRAFAIALILAIFTQLQLRRDQRSFAEFGITPSYGMPGDLIIGFLSGAFLLGIAACELWIFLPLGWISNPSIRLFAILAGAVYHLATATCEELAWRGFAFDSLVSLLGCWWAQTIVALIAACFHVVCGWSWSVALISTTAGSLLFGFVFLRWRSLPAAIGVHSAWNWTRDLILTPNGSSSVMLPQGMASWTPAQWNLAQAIMVGVTLVAALLVFANWRLNARSLRNSSVTNRP
jgi:membrane protease YdiL (CAAX protease family)